MKPPSSVKKSTRTKSAILSAARAAFAERGFERATFRDIATRAGVDPALVIRYFGSKEQLFAVAADFTVVRPSDLPDVPRSKAGRALAERYLRQWEGGTEGLPLLLRSAASNDQAAAHMRAIFANQIVPTVAALSGKAGAKERAGLVASQLLGMALCRFILKLPPIVEMPREKLVEEIGRTLQRYLSN